MDTAYGSFYITLPSNASMNVFPSNTLTGYSTQLPDALELNGDYEVGLAEIHYPHKWNTLHATESWKIVVYEVLKDVKNYGEESPRMHNITLDSKSFVDIKHLISECNSKIKEKLLTKTFHLPSLQWDDNGHCVIVHNTTEEQGENEEKYLVMYLIHLSQDLGRALGFQNFTIMDGDRIPLRQIGSQTVSPRNYFDQIYVYSDVCEEQFIGDIKASLLRVVPIKGKSGDVVSIIYEKPQYVPVVKNRVQTIQILLRTDTGEPIKFINGRVVVTLHFRRRRSTF